MLGELFSKPKKKKHMTSNSEAAAKDIPEGIMKKCPGCQKIMYAKEIEKNEMVCPHCGHHHTIKAHARIQNLVDEGTFVEIDTEVTTTNALDFPGYMEKIKSDKEKSGLNEAVVTGYGEIEGNGCMLAVMDSSFRMGSMGSVVGEKITRAIEAAEKRQVPVIIFTASGGARMQEGMLSLMQMAKTSAALERLSAAGGLSIIVMTYPTTGGVSASFASLGDFNFAEPAAHIGFAGRRVIEQTVREKLPKDFQTAEFLLKTGQLDAVIPRLELREKLGFLVSFHTKAGDK